MTTFSDGRASPLTRPPRYRLAAVLFTAVSALGLLVPPASRRSPSPRPTVAPQTAIAVRVVAAFGAFGPSGGSTTAPPAANGLPSGGSPPVNSVVPLGNTTLPTTTVPITTLPTTTVPITTLPTTTVPTTTTLPASTTTTPAAPVIVPPSLLASIATEQVEVVNRNYQVAVTAAADAVRSSRLALSSAQRALISDTARSQILNSSLQEKTVTLNGDRVAHRNAVVAYERATGALDADRHRLRALAVALYIGPPYGVGARAAKRVGSSAAALAANLADAQEADDAEASVVIAEQSVGSSVRSDATAVVVTRREQQRLGVVVGNDAVVVHRVSDQAVAAASAATGDHSDIDVYLQALSAGNATWTAAGQAQSAAVAAISRDSIVPPTAVGAAAAPSRRTAAGPPTATGTTGPTLLGPAALTVGQLTGWFSRSGQQAGTTVSIDKLAGWYLADGAVEGVRGDLAFAQAVLETGGFDSDDAVTNNNYSGIGHCDTCATGIPFASPETGVIGQLQLLRIFADATTVHGLPQPLANTSLAPATQFRRGCCHTWVSLTEVWATDPGYGLKILTLYSKMLAYALAEPPEAPSAAG